MANSHLHSRHFGFGDFEQTENTTIFLAFATLPYTKKRNRQISELVPHYIME
jgi:hypothetical protein